MCLEQYDKDVDSYHIIECDEVEKLHEELESIESKFSFMLDQMYGKRQFDRNEFESAIEEICDSLHIKMPESPFVLIENGLHRSNNETV